MEHPVEVELQWDVLFSLSRGIRRRMPHWSEDASDIEMKSDEIADK